jgi:hypothetical protein
MGWDGQDFLPWARANNWYLDYSRNLMAWTGSDVPKIAPSDLTFPRSIFS